MIIAEKRSMLAPRFQTIKEANIFEALAAIEFHVTHRCGAPRISRDLRIAASDDGFIA